MEAELVVILVLLKHVVDDGHQTVADRHNGSFFADAMREAVVLGREVIVPGVGNDPDNLSEDGS